jgi:hypothetical protein
MRLIEFLFPAKKPKPRKPEYSGDLTFVADEDGFIFDKLSELLHAQTEINAETVDRKRYFRTRIVNTDADRGIEVVCPDEVSSGLRKVLANMFEFSGGIDGVKFSFYAKPNLTVKKLQQDRLWFEWPVKIEWTERRTVYRTTIPLSHQDTYMECEAQ